MKRSTGTTLCKTLFLQRRFRYIHRIFELGCVLLIHDIFATRRLLSTNSINLKKNNNNNKNERKKGLIPNHLSASPEAHQF
jgi:hypothetical protein